MMELDPKNRPAFRRPALAALAGAFLAPITGCTIEQTFGKSDLSSAQPDIVVDPGRIVFEDVELGGDAVRQMTISNIGTAALNVAGIRVEQSTAFTVLAELPLTLPSGDSITVDVTYSPLTDFDEGYAYVDSNDPDNPNAQVELIGTSGSPRLLIDPPMWDFGELPVYCRNSITHTLSNEGTADLSLTGIYQTGEGYTLNSDVALPSTLAPGDSVDVIVEFEALLPSALTGSLWVESNDPGGMREARHTGSGDEDGVCISVPPDGDATVDLDFVAEYKMADIAFVLDTTCSMQGFANQVAASFTSIAGEVAERIPDVTFGAATFDDYNYSVGANDMGVNGDLPWILRQQQTSNIGAVNTVLGSTAIHNGADLPESAFEALFQAATGRGFDQDCNGAYDASEDVLPFLAGPGDAFAGVVGEAYDPSVEGTGELGGMGFREDVLPIVIYATDADMRDPDAGYRVPGSGTCNPSAAGFNAATTALNQLGAKAIGVVVNPGAGGGQAAQMEAVAAATGTYADIDGDGIEEPAVLQWNSGELTELVADAIESTVDSAVFDEVRLFAVYDPNRLVADISPEKYEDVPSGEEMPFTIEFDGAVESEPSDRTYAIEFALQGTIGEVRLILDRFVVHVQVPGA
jgi:hypothetical protein